MLKSQSVSKLPRTMSPYETWGFGLAGHLAWVLALPFLYVSAGNSSVYIWIVLSIIVVINGYQVKKLGSMHQDVSGGVPLYVFKLFPKFRFLSKYIALGYFITFLIGYASLGFILVETLNTVFGSFIDDQYTIFIVFCLNILGFVVAFSSTKILSIFQSIFIWPAISLILSYGIYGIIWLILSPQSPGLLLDQWPSVNLGDSILFGSFVIANILYLDTESIVLAESTNPKKTLRFLTISGWFCVPMYVLGSWVLIRTGDLSAEGFTFSILSDSFTTIFGGLGLYMALFIFLSSIILSYTSAVVLLPRILFQLSSEGMLDKRLSLYKNGILTNALLFTLCLTVFSVFFGGFEELYVSLATVWMFTYIAINFGIWKHRKTFTKHIFPKTSLIIGVFELIIVVYGGIATSITYFAIGLLLPFLPILLNWFVEKFLHFSRPSFSVGILSKYDFEFNQIITAILTVGATIFTLLFGLFLTTSLELEFLIRYGLTAFLGLSFLSIVIASWTTIPQLQVIKKAQLKLAEVNSLLEQDIAKRKNLELKLQKNLRKDSLTGLGNRLALEEEINKFFGTKSNQNNQYALIFLDLDRFKLVNDSLGHLIGDQLLVKVGKTIKKSIGRKGFVTRIGGDEFVIFFHNIKETRSVIKCANNLLESCSKTFKVGKLELSSTASVGIVFGDQRYTKFDQIVRDADVAMYTSKKSGRNKYTIFTELMQEKVMIEHTIESKLRKAIKEKNFEFHYQPIVDLQTQKISGFEVLTRLKDTNKLIYPDMFITVAEENGMILPITWILLEAVCKKMSLWSYKDMYVGVNISERVLLQPDLKDRVSALLTKYKLEPRCLHFEVLESITMYDVAIIKHNLRLLNNMGIDIAIDDFGTGYSNLSRLHNLPIASLKVDKSFVDNLQGVGFEMIKTICSLANTLGICVTVEGVETQEDLELINQLKVDKVQGYYYAKPMPASQIEDYCARHKVDHAANIKENLTA